ncbi:hypothetical protein [Agromyces sp. Leaf222]|uniref:hypothetical protein n=1 Tax=Agromyces sp. Leaf222 TaxID=1735688 RepID=UPI0006FFD3C8|nr:hypothetical protein [Agromyces sp. Leaf222]KQM84314.1 hypothetical protein ASE68_14810 [Agromyces sp. Leaf222]
MSYGGTLRSPNRHYLLSELDGSPSKIEAAGNHYIEIGARMSATADELKKLGDGEKYKAKSLDKVRESAREMQGELRNVGERYEKTGPVLVTYAGALRTARNTTVDPYVELIANAHQANLDAAADRREAQGKVDDNNTTWLWEKEATDHQKAVADAALDEAKTAATTAASKLEDLWEEFESGFHDWDKAYDDAVGDIASALEASGVDDSWWEDLLDGIATVATVIATIAVIAALVIGGPIFLAIAAVAGIVALVAHCIMMACGSKRVSWTDIAFDAIGVLPFLGAFGKGLAAGRGGMGALRAGLGFGNASSGFLAIGRNAIVRDLRTVTGAGRFVGNRAARDAAASGLADDFLRASRGSWLGNTWNALRNGGSRFDGEAYTLTQRLASAWPGAGVLPPGGRAATWATQFSTMPSLAGQGLNLWNTGYGGYQTAQATGLPLPDMPDFIGGAIDFVRGR